MSSTAGVRPEQRFTAERPCPICGGHDRKRRGEGVRCYGFLSDDGEWAHCTREEHAGGLERNAGSDAYPHKLTGDCKCGARHGLASGAERNGGQRKGPRGRIVETYDYHDEGGELLYQTVRLEEPKDFRQRRPNGRGGWEWKMEGVRRVPYRLPELLAADRGDAVLWCEGEKDAGAGAELGYTATTNAGGVKSWRAEYAEHLRGRPVVVIPHNDKDGSEYAEKVARDCYGKATSVKVVELPGVPEGGGDLVDWTDAGGTAGDLRRLVDEHPEWRPPEERDDGRVLLAKAIRDGVDPPAVLVPDVLLEGKAHAIYSGPGIGKTFLMLWLILQVLARGAPVILYDLENGLRTVAERLRAMGAKADRIDDLLHFYPHTSLPATEEGRAMFEAKLDRIKPALVCFDSWIGFLASNGLDENSANDVATFASFFIHPARKRDVATLMLDHVPHEGNHARGSTRKKDEVDVMWALSRLRAFDREQVGSVALTRKKDREGWLPQAVTFSVGGDGRGGILFQRSAGTFEAAGDDGLTPSERKCLDALKTFGEIGATATEWEKAAETLEVSRRSFYNARGVLMQKNAVMQEKGRYKVVGATKCNSSAMHQNAPADSAGAIGAAAYKAAPIAPTAPEENLDDLADLLAADEEEGE
ncbi:MAG: AAA family ATPase [Rubrobacteraceae bacterium]|nr:AAA family ATPase [Rubrobacteraceae bacterium]